MNCTSGILKSRFSQRSRLSIALSPFATEISSFLKPNSKNQRFRMFDHAVLSHVYPSAGRAAAHALQVGQCGIELESRGRTATKDWNGADTQPVNAFRTLTDIGHTLYLGLENVPWSRPYAGMAESRDGTRERRSARLNARVALAATFSRKVCAPRRTCRA